MPGDFRRIGIKVPATSSGTEAMDVAYERLAAGARGVGADFTKPDDDWMPIWAVLTKTQGTLITGNVHKHEMTEHVARLARRFGAIAIGHLHSSWLIDAEVAGGQAEYERLERIVRRQGGSTEGLPRREILMIETFSAGEVRHYHAPIHRTDAAPPTLGPFEFVLTTATAGMDARGPMIDPLVRALTKVG
jgi:hypothetical protein